MMLKTFSNYHPNLQTVIKTICICNVSTSGFKCIKFVILVLAEVGRLKESIMKYVLLAKTIVFFVVTTHWDIFQRGCDDGCYGNSLKRCNNNQQYYTL